MTTDTIDVVGGVIVIILLLMAFFVIFFIAQPGENKTHKIDTIYQMPNGANCSDYQQTRGLIQFEHCDDGSNYLNPISYKMLEVTR